MKNVNSTTDKELALQLGMSMSQLKKLAKAIGLPQQGPYTPEQVAAFKAKTEPSEPEQEQVSDTETEEAENQSALDVLRGKQQQAQGDMVTAKQRAIAANIAVNKREGATDGALGAAFYITEALGTQAQALNSFAVGMVKSTDKNAVIRDLTALQDPADILAEVEALQLPEAQSTTFSLDFDVQDLETQLKQKRAELAAEAVPLALPEMPEVLAAGEGADPLASDSQELPVPETQPEKPLQPPQPTLVA